MSEISKCAPCGSQGLPKFWDNCDSLITCVASVECEKCQNSSEEFSAPDDAVFSQEIGGLLEQLAIAHWNYINDTD